MKRVIILSSFLFLTSLFPRSAYAQTATDSPATGRRDAALTRAAERKMQLEQRQATLAARLDARRQAIVDRILAHARRMISRADSAIKRMDSIWERVKTRLDKFSQAGKDVSGLSGAIADVGIKKTAAENALSQAQTSLSQLEGSNDPKAAVAAFRESFKKVKEALKNYHQAIVLVIKSLKGMSTGVKITPPTGATVSPTVGVTP